MMRSDLESALASAIDSDPEIGWAGIEMAPIAFRRWSSFKHRHKAKSPTIENRVIDLAKGLQAHFEPKIPYTPFSEWIDLARTLAKVLAHDDGTSPN